MFGSAVKDGEEEVVSSAVKDGEEEVVCAEIEVGEVVDTSIDREVPEDNKGEFKFTYTF